jgi:DNA invertase Pin-like site-specific DNA recombinase
MAPGLPAKVLGYARVSTRAQDPALQHDALAAAGCDRVWTEYASRKGRRAARAGRAAGLRAGR